MGDGSRERNCFPILFLDQVCKNTLPSSLPHFAFTFFLVSLGLQSLGHEDPLEKEMATHSTILA